jgi:hypothetical protein
VRRRSFLKLAGVATVAATARLALPGWVPVANAAKRVTALDGKQYRGDRHGYIFVSEDAGATWNPHTFLGPQYPIRKMLIDPSGRVQANVGYRSRMFKLHLAPDAKSWMTT